MRGGLEDWVAIWPKLPSDLLQIPGRFRDVEVSSDIYFMRKLAVFRSSRHWAGVVPLQRLNARVNALASA